MVSILDKFKIVDGNVENIDTLNDANVDIIKRLEVLEDTILSPTFDKITLSTKDGAVTAVLTITPEGAVTITRGEKTTTIIDTDGIMITGGNIKIVRD